MRPGSHRQRRLRESKDLADEYHEEEEASRAPAKLVLPALKHRSTKNDESPEEDAVTVQMRRLEVQVAVQARSLEEMRNEVESLRRARVDEVRRQAEPTAKAVLRVAARQETDEERLEQMSSAVRVLTGRIESLEKQAEGFVDRGERRLTTLESQLNGVMDVRRLVVAQMRTTEDLASTTATLTAQQSVVDGLQSDVDRVARRAEAGNAAARTLRDDVAKVGADLLQSISREATLSRAVVAGEALARKDLGLSLERQTIDAARAVEEKSEALVRAVRNRLDHVAVALDNERGERTAAVESALDELERRWGAIGRLRESDQEARRYEADALRTALRVTLAETERRVDSIKLAVEESHAELTAATQQGQAEQASELADLRRNVRRKLDELERILSAEISARRTGAAKLSSRLDDLEERTRCDLLTASNRLGEHLVKHEASCDARFENCREQLRLAKIRTECAEQAAYDFADDRVRGTREAFEAALAARAACDTRRDAAHAALRNDAERWYRTSRADAAFKIAEVEGRLRVVADGDSAARAALAAQHALDDELVRVAAEKYTSLACNQLRTSLRREIAAQHAALADGLSAEAAAGSALWLAERCEDEKRAARIKAQENQLRTAIAFETQNAVETAKQLVQKESEERRAADAADSTSLRHALAAAEASFRAVLQACCMQLETRIGDARTSLSSACISEGRAARAAALALVESERADRTDADARAAKVSADLLAATKATLQADAAAARAQARAQAERFAVAEAERRVALARDLRREAEVGAKELERRRVAAEVLHATVDCVADNDSLVARRRLAREICEVGRDSGAVVYRETMARSQADAALRRRIDAGAALAATVSAICDADSRDQCHKLARDINDLRSQAREYASKFQKAMENESAKRVEGDTTLGVTLAAERRTREAADIDLAVKVADETYAREHDIMESDGRAVVGHIARRLVDAVADTETANQMSLERRNLRAEVARNLSLARRDVRAKASIDLTSARRDLQAEAENERVAAQAHLRRLSARVDAVSTDLSVEKARVAVQFATCASRDAATNANLPARAAKVALLATEMREAVDHEVEARLAGDENNREAAEIQVADVVAACNDKLAESEERVNCKLRDVEAKLLESGVEAHNFQHLLHDDLEALRQVAVAKHLKGTGVVASPRKIAALLSEAMAPASAPASAPQR